MSYKFPGTIMISLNDRDPQLHDLYKLNIANGERQLIQKNEGFTSFVIDDDYRVRFARRMTPDGGNELLKLTDDGDWEPFIKIGLEDAIATDIIGLDTAGNVLYMSDSRRRDTAALVALELRTGEGNLLASDSKADLSDTMIHPREKRVQAAAFMYERKRWQIIDQTISEDLAYLPTASPGDVEIVSRALDDKAWIVSYIVDDGPRRYYHYVPGKKEARFLFTDRRALEGWRLTKMRPVIIKSRDGFELVSYLMLPIHGEGGTEPPPDRPMPLVLLVHGGPWARDEWSFNPLYQWLTNRGYAVLGVNFRSSFGFGKALLNAGNLEWGAKMHDDLVDAVDWSVKEGIADPKRVAIFGGSYGGYATLVGMTLTPETFACGVDIVGPSNLVTLLETIPPYWQPIIENLTKRVGDHRTEEGRAFLKKRSPLTYVDRIQRPLLIGQGANDPRVKQAESDQIVKAMQQRGIAVTYVLYPDEGHGFARPENRLSFNAVAEAFLAKCLGGRYEPVGDDFKGSRITVPVGAEYIPGLAEAISGSV